jgi:hypothetical protein
MSSDKPGATQTWGKVIEGVILEQGMEKYPNALFMKLR